MRIDEALDQQVSRGGDEVGAVGGADAWGGVANRFGIANRI